MSDQSGAEKDNKVTWLRPEDYDNRRRAPLIWVLQKVVGLMGAMTRWHINWLVAFLKKH